MTNKYKVSVRLSDYSDDYRAIHVKSDKAWDGWLTIAEVRESKEALVAVDELVKSANRCEQLEAVVRDLAGKLQRLHDDCCVTHRERLDVGPMFAPSEIAVLDAREALKRYRELTNDR